MAGTIQDLKRVYLHIIDDVIAKMKPEFVQEGVDEKVLLKIRERWEEKCRAKGLLNEPVKDEPKVEPGTARFGLGAAGALRPGAVPALAGPIMIGLPPGAQELLNRKRTHPDGQGGPGPAPHIVGGVLIKDDQKPQYAPGMPLQPTQLAALHQGLLNAQRQAAAAGGAAGVQGAPRPAGLVLLPGGPGGAYQALPGGVMPAQLQQAQQQAALLLAAHAAQAGRGVAVRPPGAGQVPQPGAPGQPQFPNQQALTPQQALQLQQMLLNQQRAATAAAAAQQQQQQQQQRPPGGGGVIPQRDGPADDDGYDEEGYGYVGGGGGGYAPADDEEDDPGAPDAVGGVADDADEDPDNDGGAGGGGGGTGAGGGGGGGGEPSSDSIDDKELDELLDAEDEKMPASEDCKDLGWCLFEKVQRSKQKWRCTLRMGVVRIADRDYYFSRANVEMEFQ